MLNEAVFFATLAAIGEDLLAEIHDDHRRRFPGIPESSQGWEIAFGPPQVPRKILLGDPVKDTLCLDSGTVWVSLESFLRGGRSGKPKRITGSEEKLDL